MANGEYRDKVKNHLEKIFNDNYDDKDKTKKIVLGIEKSIYNYSLLIATKNSVPKRWESQEYREIYKDISNKILTNLDPTSYIKNDKLLEKVWSNEIDFTKLPEMAPQELFPEKWEEIIEEKMRRIKLKYDTSNKATTDAYKCPRCKKAKAFFYYLQLRSADEPMTTLLNCVECDHQWRIG